jgi:hypothetical protein
MRHVVVAFLGLLLCVSAADATPPQFVSSRYYLTGADLAVTKSLKNLCVLEGWVAFGLVGDLQGTMTLDLVLTHHASCIEPAAENVHGKATFVGSVLGESGTFDANMIAWHDEMVPSNATGKITIQHGMGDLSGLHGVLNLNGTAGPGGTGTVEGQVHFDP